MKEATGELNMTVIVIIAIAAVLALFYAFLWPTIKAGLKGNVCKSWTDRSGEPYKYVTSGTGTSMTEYCCPAGVTTVDTSCIAITDDDV